MVNTLIFNAYDIVVSFTQATINAELVKLASGGTIKKEIVLYRILNSANIYEYTVVNTAVDIPQGAEFIDGVVVPGIDINKSGSDIVLTLNFVSGNASFIDKNGFGPLAKLKQYDMAGWKYGFTVNLDLSAYNHDDKRIPSPEVQAELNGFSAANLSIGCLFLDFMSTDLKSTVPAETSCPAEMTEFMSYYFKHLDATGNPYILGYSASANNGSSFSQNIPPTLKPVGTNYTMFSDPVYSGLSNLNYTLVTEGGHGSASGTPNTLDTNWFTPNDKAAGKMMISANCFLEALILRPFYNNLQQQTIAQVSQHINVGAGNSYEAAKSIHNNTWSFNISNVNGGDDQYINQFNVSLDNVDGAVILNFTGNLHIYKEVSKDCFFCTARAYASADIGWNGTVKIFIANGELAIDKSFGIVSQHSDHDTNTCADAFSWMGKIIGGILDVFTGWTDNGMFSNLLSDAFSISLPGIGNLSVGLGNFSNTASSMVLTPTGSNYNLAPSGDSPAMDALGNIYIDLSLN
ncbi:hypothetical protein IW15_13045 [Chryseobacterium soli]|uniref:Uncharacterized protein n=1 Tax=Chryseobacterium soli TaxID=445961 RepID=A0A086A700_9FLAO|nr:hypothetical protein [Chryseobacterium soli]KFF12464.1 hypothetical protein IW15_13045 [Chryseobacterium soli]